VEKGEKSILMSRGKELSVLRVGFETFKWKLDGGWALNKSWSIKRRALKCFDEGLLGGYED
jgi:hypothetical protein